jgi:MinD superfamily P-loop ATPase
MRISVISARSGTGKTLVATSLALSLSREKSALQFLDCDVEKPDAHLFLKPSLSRGKPVSILVPKLVKEQCIYCGKCGKVCAYNAIVTFAKNVLIFPELCRGCGACSYVCTPKALTEEIREIGIIENGRSGAIKFVHGRLSPGGILPLSLVHKIREQELRRGIVIVDVAAGTSSQVVKAIEGSDFCLLAAVPDTTGNQPLNRVTETLKRLDMPSGVVLNFSGAGDNEIKEYCAIKEIPILLTIPVDIKIARNYSNGITLTAGLPEWQDRFSGLLNKIRELIGERDSSSKR